MDPQQNASRRAFVFGLTAMAAAAKATLASHAAQAWNRRLGCCSIPALTLAFKGGGISISVHPPEGGHYPGSADVVVTHLLTNKAIKLARAKGDQTYLASLPPGAYRVEVSASQFAPSSSTVEIGDFVLMHAVYLGQKNWPSFSFGPSRIPFRPTADRIAVVFASPYWKSAFDIETYLPALEQLGLVPFDGDVTLKPSYLGGGGSVLFLRTKDGGNIFAVDPTQPPSTESENLFEAIKMVFPEHTFGRTRIGVPISTTKGRLRILDNQFIVQFDPARTPQDIQSIAHKLGASVAPVRYFVGFWSLSFKLRSNYLRNLHLLDELVSNRILISGEPDLIFDLVDTAVPSDPWYECQKQEYISRQGIVLAWNRPSGLGNAQIVVATADRGLNLDHADVNIAALTCVDILNAGSGSISCETPETGHGMHVYGVISSPHNGIGVAGIAPGATHVAVVRPETNSVRAYASMLRWLARIGDSQPVDINGAPFEDVSGQPIIWPSIAPAAIINCSHEWLDMPLPYPVLKALHDLVTEGRNGLGCIVVCSAGNRSQDVQGTNAFAMSPCTLIVSNTADDKPSDWVYGTVIPESKEVKDPDSNFGLRIDLCAFGGYSMIPPDSPAIDGVTYSRAAITLGLDNGTTPNLTCRDQVATGVYPQGLTSIAAAMVSAVTALILSANPSLRWFEVRSILQGTANKIDRTGGTWKRWNGSHWVPSVPGVSAMGLDSHSPLYGFGRLNAARAVKMAESAVVPIARPMPYGRRFWSCLYGE